MREIKFRVYNKHTKKMYEVEWLSFRHNLLIVSANEDWERQQKLSDFELMQYSWLKDQDGKEIFEWDIVVTTVRHGSVRKGEIMVIVWDDTELCFIAQYIQFLNKKWYYPLRVTSNKKFRIIWNIYENPELLNP